MNASSTLKINLAAVNHNVAFFKQRSQVMAMIKANAYGTDPLQLARHLDADLLGVSHVSEGVALRKQGIEKPIFVTCVPPFEAKLATQYTLTPAVSSFEEAEAIERAAGSPYPVHLHVDTGMNRFGIRFEDALPLLERIRKSPRLVLEGISTHYSSADAPDFDSESKKQSMLFESLINQIDPKPRWIHAANGPAALRFSLPFCNLARIGLPLLGYGSPQLKPALTLTSHLVAIRMAKQGESVGYHCSYAVRQKSLRIGAIPFGYYDGYPKSYAEKGYVHIHGKRAPIVGAICMDFFLVDLTLIPEAKVGDPVTLFDEKLTAESVVSWGNIDIRELLVGIGPRTKRVFQL